MFRIETDAAANLPDFDSANYYQKLSAESGNSFWKGEKLALQNHEPFSVVLPIQWNADPFKDRTWQWDLNRFIWVDRLIADYKFSGQTSSMQRAAAFFLDW